MRHYEAIPLPNGLFLPIDIGFHHVEGQVAHYVAELRKLNLARQPIIRIRKGER